MARTIAKDHGIKRHKILKTAARVIADEGIARASMAQIAGACGISKANIYHYYTSKDALLFGILDAYLSALRDRLCGLDEASLSPDERLHQFTRETLLAYDGMDAEHKIQTEGLPLLPEEQQMVLKAYQREMVQALSDVLRDAAPDVLGADAGRLRATAMSVFGMLNWFYKWNPRANRAAREEYAGLVADLTLRGVLGPFG